MAINIRAYTRDETSGIQQQQQPGALRGGPSREFGPIAPPAHIRQPTAGLGRGNRGNNRSDVSIQVDVGSKTSIAMGRTGKGKGGGCAGGSKTDSQPEIPLYSREDIREQYCINKKELDGLERSSHLRRAKGFFGCLTSRKDKSGKNKKRSSFFSALCVRRASEENLYNGCNKPVVNANRSVTLPAIQPFTVPLRDDGPSQPSLFRHRPQSFCTSDPRRFSMQTPSTPCIVNSYAPRHSDPDWKISAMPVHRTISDAPPDLGVTGSQPFRYGGRLAYTQPNTPELSAAIYRRQVMSSEALADDRRSIGSTSKHVSFDASSPNSEIYTSAVPANASKSQERLLDGRKTPEPFPDRHHAGTFSPVLARAILLERLRQASMRSQCTQTDGYYNSTTSLSYPSCAASQVSIPASVAVSTVNRQVQTNFEPRSRLSQSSTAVNQSEPDEAARQGAEPEFLRLGRRPEEMSQSQPEVLGEKSPSDDDHRTDARSKRQLLKALSEGTILVDRQDTRLGYVDVNVPDLDDQSPPLEEMVAGRVLVHDPMRFPGSSDSGSLNDEDEAVNRNLASSREANRSKSETDEWTDGEASNQRDKETGKQQPEREEGRARLRAQKSVDSNASGTPGNYSDEFGSTSQVTVVPQLAARQQEIPETPEVAPPSPRPRPADEMTDDSEKEIMVEFPPWPGGQDNELIPAPPSFASVLPPPEDEDEMPSLPPPPPPPPNIDEEPSPVVDSLPPPPAPDEVCTPEAPVNDRFLLRRLKNGPKSMSETITSVDSDSSGRRVTEHETSVSSEPVSPASPVIPEAQTGITAAQEASPETSDAFLTALSDQLTATGLTSGADVFNTAMERSERSFRESDTSHNSTLRFDHASALELPYESVPDGLRTSATVSPAAAPSPPAPVDDVVQEAINSGALMSPDSNNEATGEFCRGSSTSGSYSLEAVPGASLSPVPPIELEFDKPPHVEDNPVACPREFSSSPVPRDEDLSSTTITASVPATSTEKQVDPIQGRILPTSGSVPVATTSLDRKLLKKEMKLQFPPGTSMFSGSASSVSTPLGRSTGRRKHMRNQLSSSESDDAEEPVANERRKRRSNKTGEPSSESSKRPGEKKHKHKSQRQREATTPGTAHAEGGAVRKRDSQVAQVMTPGMVRSPAMHEGFRMEDWMVQRSDIPAPPPPLPAQQPIVQDLSCITLQHPSESSDVPVEILAAQWGLLAPGTTSHQQQCDSIRSVSPGSDNVFVSESTELPSAAVVKPPEGFADSPVALGAGWCAAAPRSPLAGGDGLAECGGDESTKEGARRKRDSGRNKRTKSCTLPSGGGGKSDHLSGSTQSLEGSGSPDGQSTPHRAVSASDMWYPETQLPPKRQLTVRAKSEERERWSRPIRRNMGNLARSIEANWDPMGSKLSCDGTPLDDEDAGIYCSSYRAAAWAYIGETEELKVWKKSQPQTPIKTDPLDTDDSSTASEKDFRRKYTSITHRMVHRKSSVEMFKRLATSTFDDDDDDDDDSGMWSDESGGSVRHSLIDIYQLMLMIWCRENLAVRRLAHATGECDDVVFLKRESGEFGFRIHGSRPVVVSAIEPGTPAEQSGLQVGDIIISINDVNVLDSSHSDVVRIAHAGSDELRLEVARTSNLFALGAVDLETEDQQQQQLAGPPNETPILTGYLWKKSQSASRLDESGSVWYRRWFVLKRNNCLYYYKNQDSSQPLGAVSLLHYTVTRTALADRAHGLILSKGGTIRHWLAAETSDSADDWQSVFEQASRVPIQDVWLDMCAENVLLPPGSIPNPDCVGHLMKLGHRAKEWQRRFCVLKDACLYFYVDINVSSALGALHLHGYRVQSSGTTASSGERRKFAFELLPPEPRMRHFHFYTDSENDRKRWIAALEYSIDRWIRVG